jgi:hypothetical protein
MVMLFFICNCSSSATPVPVEDSRYPEISGVTASAGHGMAGLQVPPNSISIPAGVLCQHSRTWGIRTTAVRARILRGVPE